MMRVLAMIAAIAFTTSAAAQQLPLPKSGGCPPGFRASGSYCVSGEDTRTLAVPKTRIDVPRGLDHVGCLLHEARRAAMTRLNPP
jgi:hypothetical protein